MQLSAGQGVWKSCSQSQSPKHVRASRRLANTPVCQLNYRHVAAHATRSGAAALCGLLLCCQPVQAANLLLVVLDSGNSAILGDLKRLSKTKERFGTQEAAPGVLSSRFVGAQQQLQRIELLVKIGQYDNARMQLREGSFKTLRMDLGYGQEMYRVVKPQVVREVVEGVEQLDGQLKRREPAEAIKPQLQQLQEKLADLIELMASMSR